MASKQQPQLLRRRTATSRIPIAPTLQALAIKALKQVGVTRNQYNTTTDRVRRQIAYYEIPVTPQMRGGGANRPNVQMEAPKKAAEKPGVTAKGAAKSATIRGTPVKRK